VAKERTLARVTAHIVLVVVGGYIGASGIVALLSVALPAFAGMARSDAVVLSSMSGFIFYLALFLWGIAYRHSLRLALWLFVLTGACFSLVAVIHRVQV
jgi:hypothetical protein